MLTLTLGFIALLTSSCVSADRAITTPVNGTTVRPGQEVELEWYSDEEDVRSFDVALVSLIPLGSYSATNRIVSQSIQIPNNTPVGQYYLGVNEQDGDDNDTGVDSYDLRLKTPGQISGQVIVVDVTAANTKRDWPLLPWNRALSSRQNTNNDDEILYSPVNSSVAIRSSFNLTYRTDDEHPREVLVGLIRYWTGIQGSSSVQTTGGRAMWEGTIVIPSDASPGEYSVGVFAERTQEAQVGQYDLTFSSSAHLSGNDLEIPGPERPLVLIVSSDGAAPSGSSGASSQNPSFTPTSSAVGGGGGTAVQSSTAAAVPAASSSGSASMTTVCKCGLLTGLLAWFIL